jgi:hypothetical protein
MALGKPFTMEVKDDFRARVVSANDWDVLGTMLQVDDVAILFLKVQRNLPAGGGKCPPRRGNRRSGTEPLATTSYLEDALELFHQSKKLAERAMEQVTDEQLFAPLDSETNSIAALESLSEVDLVRTVTIRGEPHSVMQAVDRQVTHYALHVGPIVLLARHFAGHRWKSLSVPRN